MCPAHSRSQTSIQASAMLKGEALLTAVTSSSASSTSMRPDSSAPKRVLTSACLRIASRSAASRRGSDSTELSSPPLLFGDSCRDASGSVRLTAGKQSRSGKRCLRPALALFKFWTLSAPNSRVASSSARSRCWREENWRPCSSLRWSFSSRNAQRSFGMKSAMLCCSVFSSSSLLLLTCTELAMPCTNLHSVSTASSASAPTLL
mmetsp:Transcript_56102/g.132155  ORF Transcript_56102/g.132155 Transcript_56102/m.132155 type:complete len:205 (-) Transcript_56102:674-1288(-)